MTVASTPDSKSDNQAASEAFVEKLRKALRRDGDFPASAKVVAELKKLVADPGTTANQISEVILREPSLGTRVLHLVNSSFYRRAKPIMTVSHAVVQIGMRPLAELCAGLVLLQRFVPAAREGGPFATCLQQTIATSLLASSIGNAAVEVKTSKTEETGYLAGTFFELGILLTAYYFPKVYESALKRSSQKKQPISKSLQELTGLNSVQLSIEVIKALNLPELYVEVIRSAESGHPSPASDLPGAQRSAPPKDLYRALYAAKTISAVLVASDSSKQKLDDVIGDIQQKVSIGPDVLQTAIGELPQKLKDHCQSLELTLPELPEYVDTYTAPDSVAEAQAEEAAAANPAPEADEGISQFLQEIRAAVANREPTASIITSVMETLAFGLHFDRVMLMLVDQTKRYLQGRMALGNTQGVDPQTIQRPVGREAGPYALDALALAESRPVFLGDPIFEDGWPIAAIPIGFEGRGIGVIYCDRYQSDQDELSRQEQASIGMLAELLDRSLSQKG